MTHGHGDRTVVTNGGSGVAAGFILAIVVAVVVAAVIALAVLYTQPWDRGGDTTSPVEVPVIIENGAGDDGDGGDGGSGGGGGDGGQ